MSLCVVAAGKTLLLATTVFSLSWTHSVEKTGWQEDWQLTPAGLVLTAARVKGSGAGMEPGEGAVLRDGWWEWVPTLPAQAELHLAASGATGSGWELCYAAGCLQLAEEAGEAVALRACGDTGIDHNQTHSVVLIASRSPSH